MKYFVNGGGAEFDHLLLLQQQGWFKENGIKTLLVIPLAIKEDYWQNRWVKPMQLFEAVGGPIITSITTYSDEAHLVSAVKHADAVYFPGGSQEALLRRMHEMDILSRLRKSTNIRAVGGGSAGMMCMGEKVIIGATTTKNIIDGLAFLANTICDSHFSRHSRLPRLKNAIDDYSGFTGIGIDDNTGIIIGTDFKIEKIFGVGTVTVYRNGEKIIYDKNSL